MNRAEQSLPLLELFNRLRQAGLPLGLDEYTLALRALQSGFGTADKQELARLCRTLWVKSEEEKLLFNYHFEQVMEEWRTQFLTAAKITLPVQTLKPDQQRKKNFLPKPLKHFWFAGGALLLVTAIGLWFAVKLRKECPYFTNSAAVIQATVGQEFRHTVGACKTHQNDKLKIIPLKKPTWLNFEVNPDGTATLSGKPSKNYWYLNAHLWSLSGKLQGEFQFPGSATADSYNELYFHLNNYSTSSDGRHFTTRDSDRVVNLWDLSRKRLAKLEHPGRVNDVAFSPDNQLLATAAGDGIVRVWNLEGQLQRTMSHQSRVLKVHFNYDGKYLSTLAVDGMVRLWNRSGKKLAEFGHDINDLYGFSLDGQHIVTASDQKTVELWNLSGKRLAKVDVDAGFWVSSDAQWIIVRSDRTDTASLRNQFGKQVAKLSPFLLSNHSQIVVVASSNYDTVRLWNLSGEQLKVLQHQDRVNSVSFSPHKQLVATASDDRTVKLWDVASQQSRLLLTIPHKGPVFRVWFSPNRQHLVTISAADSYEVVLQVTNKAGKTDVQSFNIRVREPLSIDEVNNQKLITLAIAGGVAIFVVAGVYAIARRWLERAQSSVDEPSEKTDTSHDSQMISESQPEPKDEVQVGKAMLTANQVETSEYFPVTRRQMKQNWRYLRQMIREGPPTELDVEETIKQISRQGILLEPVLTPRRVNRAELLLLLDQEGSMVPFHSLARRLAETALQGGCLARVGVYYFHNCPDDYLYNEPRCTQAMPVDAVLSAYSNSVGVLIFSDAGAARGSLSQERLQLSAEFLAHLKQRVRYIAWLNPMPASRWQGTSAERIAHLVPMFEFSRQGMYEAIAVLRGKFTPHL